MTPSQTELDFGTLAKGGKGEVTFWLHNTGTSAVEVTRVETSCCCFELELQEKVIEPEGKVAVRAKVDLAKEPQFLGSLRLEASGFTSSKGVKAFMVYGTVNVASTETGRGR